MNKSLIKRTFFLFFAVLALTGCSHPALNLKPSDQINQPSSTLPLSEVLKGQHPIAFLQLAQLLAVDPEFPDPQTILSLGEKEIPPVVDLFTFKVSPTKHFIVWYAPEKGLLRLNLTSKELATIHEPSSWLNKNPFFAFYNDQDRLSFIDNNGTELVTIDLATSQKDITRIPYPFGNLFVISPDGRKIVFVSGFGQTEKNPQYMFTDIDGANPKRFITNTALPKRHLLAWLPDSSGIVVVASDSKLLFVSSDKPNIQDTYYQTEGEEEIVDLARIDNLFYLLTAAGRWRVIDTTTRQETGRIPLQIAEELHRPKFYPWFNQTFLIEETLRLDPEEYKRLWLSSYIGVKKNVVGKYQETTIQATTPAL